jgi:tetratricopeptide (TPR) repeat protein
VRGEMTRAKPLIENARLLRERLGRNYLLALSYNTTGEIHTAADELEDALAWCERARQIFATVEEPRGLGLSYIALGRAHRKFGDKGKRGQYPFEQTQREFEQAETYLNKALAIFGGDDPSVEEPYRLWETLNELGSTYVDWGYLLTWYNLQEQMNEKYHLAVKYQEEAIEKAKKAKFLLPLLDSYDDLAQAYADWGKPKQAEEYLEKIYREVPQEYRLVAGEGFPEITDPVDGYWRVLGKYHLQRGIWAYREAEQAQEPARKDSLLDETVRHFALAIAYFQKFSPAIAQVVSTQHAMYRRFTTLELERLDRLRQKVEEVAQDYNVDLGYLLDTLDDTLGAPLHL